MRQIILLITLFAGTACYSQSWYFTKSGDTIFLKKSDNTDSIRINKPDSPQGSNYRTLVTLSSDITNNNAVANTLADVTGLSFNVISGVTYRFYAVIPYTSAATTTGSRWTINGPANTLLSYTSRYSLTATATTINFASAYNIPAASNATSLAAGNVCVIEGVITPSANGVVQIRFASEVASSAIIAKQGATLEYW